MELVCCRYVWCLDFKGGLFCSILPETGLKWQRFEDNVHQMAVSPSGEPELSLLLALEISVHTGCTRSINYVLMLTVTNSNRKSAVEGGAEDPDSLCMCQSVGERETPLVQSCRAYRLRSSE